MSEKRENVQQKYHQEHLLLLCDFPPSHTMVETKLGLQDPSIISTLTHKNNTISKSE